jgi:hypothetical protein
VVPRGGAPRYQRLPDESRARADLVPHTAAEIGRQTARLAQLDSEREKLLKAHYAEAVPLDLLKREQARIGKEMAAAQAALGRLNTELGAVERGLNQALALVADCHQLYLDAPPHIRRQLNQAVFERIFVEDGDVPTGQLASPFGELLELAERTEDKERGSEEQLKRYLRTAPAQRTSTTESRQPSPESWPRTKKGPFWSTAPKEQEPWPPIAGPGFERWLLAAGPRFEPGAPKLSRDGAP